MSRPRIAVIGAGLMGHGIAYLFAAAGHPVKVVDRDQAALDRLPARLAEIAELHAADRELLGRVSGGTDLGAAVADADIVIEAASENLVLKREIFAALGRLAPAEAILATNT